MECKRQDLIRIALDTQPIYIVHLATSIYDSYMYLKPKSNPVKIMAASIGLATLTRDGQKGWTNQMSRIYTALSYSVCFPTVIEHLDPEHYDIANSLLLNYAYRRWDPIELAAAIKENRVNVTDNSDIVPFEPLPKLSQELLGDLKSFQELDSGTFGTVYTQIYDRKRVALKYITPDYFDVNETGFLSTLNHPHIVKYIGSCSTKRRSVIMTEFLDTRLYRTATRSWPFKIKCQKAVALLDALTYLHKHKVMHRDLTTKNVMLKNNVLKIIDFGTAIRYLPNEEYDLRVCAPYCRAPEIFAGNKTYDMKIDVWSAACVITFIFTGKNPFLLDNEEGILNHAKNMDFETLGLDLRILPVMKRMFQIDPADRCTASEALDEFIKIDSFV